MASNETKARQLFAKFHAFSNAAQMIGSHGEEGFSYDDEKFNDAYLKQCAKAKKTLTIAADKAYIAYKKIGIEIDCSVSDDAGYVD